MIISNNIKNVIVLLLLITFSLMGIAQTDCTPILSIVKKEICDGNLDRALEYLQDAEICDYSDQHIKERQDLQEKIFDAIKKQRKDAEDNKVLADERLSLFLSSEAENRFKENKIHEAFKAAIAALYYNENNENGKKMRDTLIPYLTDIEDEVVGFKFSKDSSFLAYSKLDSSLVIWDIKNNKRTKIDTKLKGAGDVYYQITNTGYLAFLTKGENDSTTFINYCDISKQQKPVRFNAPIQFSLWSSSHSNYPDSKNKKNDRESGRKSYENSYKLTESGFLVFLTKGQNPSNTFINYCDISKQQDPVQFDALMQFSLHKSWSGESGNHSHYGTLYTKTDRKSYENSYKLTESGFLVFLTKGQNPSNTFINYCDISKQQDLVRFNAPIYFRSIRSIRERKGYSVNKDYGDSYKLTENGFLAFLTKGQNPSNTFINYCDISKQQDPVQFSRPIQFAHYELDTKSYYYSYKLTENGFLAFLTKGQNPSNTFINYCDISKQQDPVQFNRPIQFSHREQDIKSYSGSYKLTENGFLAFLTKGQNPSNTFINYCDISKQQDPVQFNRPIQFGGGSYKLTESGFLAFLAKGQNPSNTFINYCDISKQQDPVQFNRPIQSGGGSYKLTENGFLAFLTKGQNPSNTFINYCDISKQQDPVQFNRPIQFSYLNIYTEAKGYSGSYKLTENGFLAFLTKRENNDTTAFVNYCDLSKQQDPVQFNRPIQFSEREFDSRYYINSYKLTENGFLAFLTKGQDPSNTFINYCDISKQQDPVPIDALIQVSYKHRHSYLNSYKLIENGLLAIKASKPNILYLYNMETKEMIREIHQKDGISDFEFVSDRNYFYSIKYYYESEEFKGSKIIITNTTIPSEQLEDYYKRNLQLTKEEKKKYGIDKLY